MVTTLTCSWCGHPSHGDTCPREITTRGGKTPTTTPCPCARGLRFVTHHITCTEGCASPDHCTQPGETPCPCHSDGEEA